MLLCAQVESRSRIVDRSAVCAGIFLGSKCVDGRWRLPGIDASSLLAYNFSFAVAFLRPYDNRLG